MFVGGRGMGGHIGGWAQTVTFSQIKNTDGTECRVVGYKTHSSSPLLLGVLYLSKVTSFLKQHHYLGTKQSKHEPMGHNSY